MYTQAKRGVIRSSDGAHITPDATPAEWQGYRDWLRSGNVPAPRPLPVSAVTQPELFARLKHAVRAHMDAAARAREYDDIKSASLRAGYPGPRQAEGIAYAQWMDACWDYVRQVRADVIAGIRTIPSKAALISELPALSLPA